MPQRQTDAQRKQAGIQRVAEEQERQSPTPTQPAQTPAQAPSPPQPQQSASPPVSDQPPSPQQPTSPQAPPPSPHLNPQHASPAQATPTTPSPGQEQPAPSAENPSTTPAPAAPVTTGTEEPPQQRMPQWLHDKIESTRRRPVQTAETAQLPAAQGLVRELVNKNRMADQQFHLVVIPEDGSPRRETLETVEALVARMQELMGTDAYLFPFMGNHLKITKGPHRYLETPYGALPLFVVPDPTEAEYEEDGFVGAERVELADPTPAADGDEDDEYTDSALQLPAEPTDTPVLPDA